MSTVTPTTPPLGRFAEPDAEIVVSVVIPCLNVEANIECCVTRARETLEDAGIAGEVVVADNASDDL